MNRRDFLSGITASAILLGCQPVAIASQSRERKRILYYTKSSGYEHPAVKPAGKGTGYGERVLRDLADLHNLEITSTKDGSVFTEENIAKYDGFFFYTTGDLCTPGTDGQPPMTEEGKSALLDAISKGKAFIGTHSAADTFHTKPDPEDRSNRYIAHGSKSDPYIKMLGAEFIKHGTQQKAHMTVADQKFPGLQEVGDGFDMLEEWYSFKDYSKDLHVILVQETMGAKEPIYTRPAFPATWVRRHGRGRVFYTSMGHREDVWANPLFQAILVGGMNWALRRTQADIKPNIERAAPGYRVIPPIG